MTAKALNRLACRAIATMQKYKTNCFYINRDTCVERPHYNPYNDSFEVYLGDNYLGSLVRPGCARDWELHPEVSVNSPFLQLFTTAIEEFA